MESLLCQTIPNHWADLYVHLLEPDEFLDPTLMEITIYLNFAKYLANFDKSLSTFDKNLSESA